MTPATRRRRFLVGVIALAVLLAAAGISLRLLSGGRPLGGPRLLYVVPMGLVAILPLLLSAVLFLSLASPARWAAERWTTRRERVVVLSSMGLGFAAMAAAIETGLFNIWSMLSYAALGVSMGMLALAFVRDDDPRYFCRGCGYERPERREASSETCPECDGPWWEASVPRWPPRERGPYAYTAQSTPAKAVGAAQGRPTKRWPMAIGGAALLLVSGAMVVGDLDQAVGLRTMWLHRPATLLDEATRNTPGMWGAKEATHRAAAWDALLSRGMPPKVARDAERRLLSVREETGRLPPEQYDWLARRVEGADADVETRERWLASAVTRVRLGVSAARAGEPVGVRPVGVVAAPGIWRGPVRAAHEPYAWWVVVRGFAVGGEEQFGPLEGEVHPLENVVSPITVGAAESATELDRSLLASNLRRAGEAVLGRSGTRRVPTQAGFRFTPTRPGAIELRVRLTIFAVPAGTVVDRSPAAWRKLGVPSDAVWQREVELVERVEVAPAGEDAPAG